METTDCNSCDHGHTGRFEVRVLPLAGDGNLIVCREHHRHEIAFRRDRNSELSKDCAYDLPTWDSLKVYEPC